MRVGVLGLVLFAAASLLNGCGSDTPDLTCEEYYALGTGVEPVKKQRAVVDHYIADAKGNRDTEASLAHMATLSWCNERNTHQDFVHSDDHVSEFLATWEG